MLPNWKVKRIKLPKDEYESIRLEVYESQGWRCAHCAEMKPLTLDHIIKRSQGGGDERSNLRGLCLECHDYMDNQGGKSKEKNDAEVV